MAKFLRFDNGHEVDIKVLDLQKLRKSNGRSVSMVKIRLSISLGQEKGQIYGRYKGTLPEFLCTLWL